jgi:streptogramin lyase
MRKDLSFIGALWLVLAGCGGHTMQAPAPAGVLPQSASSIQQTDALHRLVFQNSVIPVNWTRFAWGDTVQKPAPYGGAVTAGGNIWYTDYYGNYLIKMTMSGATTKYHLTCTCPTAGTLFYPADITVGKDGKFYIGTSSPSGYIGIATQTGSFSVKAIPSKDLVYYGGAAVGPDGNLWFTEASHFAKITTGGVITEFKYPDGNASNYYGDVASGPNGDLWISEYNKNQIDEVDPDTDAVASYTMPCAPFSVITASDGNVYAMCTSYLLRINAGGSFTQIYIPGFGPDGYPGRMTKGPDGNPWWTVSGHNDLGSYSPQLNQAYLFVPPTSYSASYALTSGSDGNIWALDSGGFTDVYILKILNFTPKPITFTTHPQTIVITVTEPGTVAWTATSSNTAIATVTAGASASQFKVNSIAKGSATITVKDAIGNSTSALATVP